MEIKPMYQAMTYGAALEEMSFKDALTSAIERVDHMMMHQITHNLEDDEQYRATPFTRRIKHAQEELITGYF